MPKVTVKVETDAEGYRLDHNLDEIPLNNGTGSIDVPYGEVQSLHWEVAGAPLTSYKITLTPEEGTLQISGDHPINLSIAAGFVRAGGHRYFRIKEKVQIKEKDDD